MPLERPQRLRLLDLARAAIGDSLRGGNRLQAPDEDWPIALSAHGASFITLSIHGSLRGCCGSVEAARALVDDVWHNARRSAFEDPRFTPLREAEVPDAMLEISVLGPLQGVPALSSEALVAQLQPRLDGLLLSCGTRRATFLPKVWETLPDPQMFVTQLKRKMGVADDFWSDAMVAERYVTQEFCGTLRGDDGSAPSTRPD